MLKRNFSQKLMFSSEFSHNCSFDWTTHQQVNMKISIRVIFVLVYACAIVVIQPESNPYNFIIDSFGFAMSILSSSFLLIFLTSRPQGEKNFINRVLTLIMICFILNTAWYFLLSMAVNFLTNLWRHIQLLQQYFWLPDVMQT